MKKIITAIVLLFAFAMNAHAQKNGDFNRALAAEDIYNTCKKMLFDDDKRSQLLYSVGTTPETVCRCSGDGVAKKLTMEEFNYIKQNNKYPDSFFEKLNKDMYSCAVITSTN